MNIYSILQVDTNGFLRVCFVVLFVYLFLKLVKFTSINVEITRAN